MDRGHGAYLLLLLPLLALPRGGALQPVPHLLMKRVAVAAGGLLRKEIKNKWGSGRGGIW